MLRANGHTIVNLTDLNRYADLWQLFNQTEQFCGFAEIHCLPLALMLDEKNTAVYLNKLFWLQLLREKELQPSGLAEADPSPEGCAGWIERRCIAQYERDAQRKQFIQAGADEPENWNQPWDQLVDQAAARFLAGHPSGDESRQAAEELREDLKEPDRADETLREAVREELRQERVVDKLQIILAEMKKSDMKEAGIALGLLAVCILVEREPQEGIIPVQKVKPEPEAAFGARISGNAQEQKLAVSAFTLTALQTIGQDAIREQPERLVCRPEPYRWAVYEHTTLTPGDIIQTIRIEAAKSRDEYGKSHIQLYSEKSGLQVWETWLAPGEYRYCNVAGGKVIRILPTMSICERGCVYRPSYYSSDLLVRQRDSMESFRLAYGDKVTCFDVCADGELYLRKGTVMTNRYQLSRNIGAAVNQLAAVSFEQFVELRLTDNGFLLLNNRGKVRSNLPEWNGRDAVSLSGTGWMRRLAGDKYAKVREFSTNNERNALVFREEKQEDCTVLWSVKFEEKNGLGLG